MNISTLRKLDLATLTEDVNNGYYVTAFKHIKVGQKFHYNGVEYTRCRCISGLRYNKTTHMEERIEYNATYLEAGEYTCYVRFEDGDTVTVKEEN